MDFWDGMESVFLMPNITLTERMDVWDAVSGYIQQQLLQHKGVRIPTFGSFDVVSTETCVGDRTVVLQRPVFHLARNLGGVYNLMGNNLTGDKELEPLKYAKVAEEASVSLSKVEGCIPGTTSLLYHCLRKGESVAFILRDVGVLLLQGREVQMRFYPDFLEKITGKEIQERATLKVLQQLDVVVPRDVPVPSLAFTTRVIIFPEFEHGFLHMSLPREPPRAFRDVPGWDKWKEKEGLPAVRQGMEGRLPGLPVPAHLSSKAGKQPWAEEGMKDSPWVRKQPMIPGAVKKQPGTEQAKGKPTAKGQVSKQSHPEAQTAQRGREGRDGEAKDPLGRGGKKAHPGREGDEEDPLRGEGEKKVHFGREGARKESLGREGEKKAHLQKEGAAKDSLGRKGEKKAHLQKEGAAKDSLGRGEKKVHPQKEGEEKVPLETEGGKKVHPEKEGGKKVHHKKGEKKVSPKRKKKARFVKDPLTSEGEEKLLPGREGGKKVPPGSPSLSKSAQALDCTSKVFILQKPRPGAAQGLRTRPEAFWSVLKEPQRSILAASRFESSPFVPPLPPEESLGYPKLKRRDEVCKGLWPWLEAQL